MKDYYNNKKLAVNICILIIGIALWGLNFAGRLPSESWGTCGVVLVVIEAFRIAQNIKYRTDAEYKKKIDIEALDERNSYIRMKAWSVTGYVFVIGAAIISIALYLTGRNEAGQILSYCVCAEMLIYYVSYLILNRKY